MPLPSSTIFQQRFSSSRQLIPGDLINAFMDQNSSFQGNITALAGGGRSVNTPVLNAANCEITVCATAADSVILPPAKVGMVITILNSGAAAAQLFANGSDLINTTAGSAGTSIAVNLAVMLVCVKNGVWRRFISA